MMEDQGSQGGWRPRQSRRAGDGTGPEDHKGAKGSEDRSGAGDTED